MTACQSRAGPRTLPAAQGNQAHPEHGRVREQHTACLWHWNRVCPLAITELLCAAASLAGGACLECRQARTVGTPVRVGPRNGERVRNRRDRVLSAAARGSKWARQSLHAPTLPAALQLPACALQCWCWRRQEAHAHQRATLRRRHPLRASPACPEVARKDKAAKQLRTSHLAAVLLGARRARCGPRQTSRTPAHPGLTTVHRFQPHERAFICLMFR